MNLIEYVEAVRIGTPEDIRGAAERFRDIVAEICGLKVAAHHNIADKHPMLDADGNVLASEVFGWSGQIGCWWRVPRLALESPLTTACRFESEPFWANAHGFHTTGASPFLAAMDLSNFEQQAKTPAAIVAPVHLPFGQIGAVSFNHPDSTQHDLSEPYSAHNVILGMLARTFVSTYVRATPRSQRLSATSRLSKREVECLRWASIGKTDHEIGMIMSRSRATIRFHIHNASVKLDAVNRSQTLFKAAQLGYIGGSL